MAATGRRPAATLTRARILLKVDAGADGWTDDRIAQALDTSPATIARVRKRFVQHGLQAGGQVGALADLLQQRVGRGVVACVAQGQGVVELGAGLVWV